MVGTTATATAALTPAPRAVALGGAVVSSRVDLSGETGTIYGTYACTATRSASEARGQCTLADQATRPLLLLVDDGGRRVCGNYFLPDEDGVLLLVVTERALGAVAFGETLRWTGTATRPADRDRVSIREGEVTLTGSLGPDGASGEFVRGRARGTFTLNAETCPQRNLAR